VHFKDSNVLKLVSLFFAHVDLSPRKLIDYLIADKSAIGLRVARSKMVLRSFSCAAGAAWTLSQRQIAVQKSATPASGMQMRDMLTPFERSAISSLSAESRPNTSRIAVSNPQGIVKISEKGIT